MRRATRMAALGAALTFLALPAWGTGFSDLNEAIPQRELAELLAQKGILAGQNEGYYGGQGNLTRYELAGILNTLLDPHDVPFNVVAWSDVPPGHPSLQAVSRVTSLNLLDGEGGRFQGLRLVRRIEFVEALANLLGYRSISAPAPRATPLTFSDVPAGSPSGRLLDHAANFWQFVELPPRARFRSGDAITRFEALDMLGRALMLIDPSLQGALRTALSHAAQPTAEPTLAPTTAPTPRRYATPRPTPVVTPVFTPRPTMTPTEVPTPIPTVAPPPEPTATPEPTPTPPPTPTPQPTPRLPFWMQASPTPAPPASPIPSSPPQPSAAPTMRPASAPTPHAMVTSPGTPPPALTEGDSLFVNRGRVGFDMVMAYFEGVPYDQSLSTSTDLSGMSATLPGMFNLDLQGAYWLGNWGATGALGTILPITGTFGSSSVNLSDVNLHVEGLYRLGWRGPNWETAGGAGLLLHMIAGSGSDYLSTSKNGFGLGPAGLLRARVMPSLVLEGGLQLYPVVVELYDVTGHPGLSVLRFGSGWQLGGEYELMQLGPVRLSGQLAYQGTFGMMYDVSAFRTVHLLTFGAGGRF